VIELALSTQLAPPIPATEVIAVAAVVGAVGAPVAIVALAVPVRRVVVIGIVIVVVS
jgi:hypothetical protein